ncbi:hypothetical protein [Luteimonas aquatica]|uniref:hypothetical protein n=1 Tax=Luteimonas aquatica TaxID=450364 RepID=UPI001F5A8105|nr:hypothetical protein [Luteimonas aquatica]
MWKTISLAMALLCAATTAAAQQSYVEIEKRLTPEQLHEVGLTPAQLELLNRMLRESGQREAAARPVPVEGGQGAASLIGLHDEPIKSRLKGGVSEWGPGTVFELENGQRWQVLKGSMKLRKPLQAPEVVVVPGIAGRWFLQVDEDVAKPRVFRID